MNESPKKHYLKKLLSLLTAILIIFSFTILDSFAAGDAFLTQICNASNIVTGNGGKAFAAFAVIAVGIGFFSGKVSWGLLIGVSMGVGSIFGAPSIVAAISGQSAFQCDSGVTYVTVCTDGVCSSCPRGRTGDNCTSCLTGFTGANCATCDTGYIGALCDECDTQYIKVAGFCVLRKCDSGPIVGVAAANTSVNLGTSSINCDATNYSGNVTYSCSNGSFSIIANNCTCPAKYDQSNCTSCATGYSGPPGCNDCATNYTKVGGICQIDCQTSGFPGIPDNTRAIAPSGTLSCSGNYTGIINYTCENGIFDTSDSCNSISYSSCFSSDENGSLTMTAPTGKVWTSVVFASYGTPSSCVSSSCNAATSTSIVSAACVGRSTCTISASNAIFTDPCVGNRKRLNAKFTY